MGWIEEHSPSEVSDKYSQPLGDMIKDSDQTLLRILHYPPLKGDEEVDAIRAAAHEDINLITILPAANEPGLQVKAKDGSWIEVPCDFGNLIVNIGDMLQEASGGYFPSHTCKSAFVSWALYKLSSFCSVILLPQLVCGFFFI